MNKETLERLVEASESCSKDNLCPRCGKEMRAEKVENALSRYAGVYICSDCGFDEAMSGALPFGKWKVVKDVLAAMNTVEGRREFIRCAESGLYDGSNVDGEMVVVTVTRGKGMNVATIHAAKPNWWEVVEYDEGGHQLSVTYKPAN